MNRYAGPASRATPSTLCQKCLKKGHYSECKALPQARPYITRPSRTQQLLNPKLMPQLTSETLPDPLRKKGVADEQLARVAEERGRKRRRVERNDSDDRSESMTSSISVSTISTKASRSPTPQKMRDIQVEKSFESRGSTEFSKNDRFPHSEYPDRRQRRRMSSRSPARRGRARSRSSSSSFSDKQKSSVRRHSKKSPEYRKSRGLDDEPGFRKSPPYTLDASVDRNSKNNPRLDTRRRRSLSPYSKRLALTQAMNM